MAFVQVPFICLSIFSLDQISVRMIAWSRCLMWQFHVPKLSQVSAGVSDLSVIVVFRNLPVSTWVRVYAYSPDAHFLYVHFMCAYFFFPLTALEGHGLPLPWRPWVPGIQTFQIREKRNTTRKIYFWFSLNRPISHCVYDLSIDFEPKRFRSLQI